MNTSQSGARESDADTKLESLLNEYEYASIVKRSVASIRRDRVRRIGCPYVKLGALVRYRPDDVRAHIERNLRPLNLATQPTPETR
jgi:hypothetical protein